MGGMQAMESGSASGVRLWGQRGGGSTRAVAPGAIMTDEPTPAGGSLPAAACIAAIAARQDRQAFAALFASYAPRIKTYLMRGGASAAVAEELAQETLLMVWRKAASFDPARAGASGWIFAIARNLRIDRLRRERRAALETYEALDFGEEPEQPDRALMAVERDARVRTALGVLPPEQMQVVELSFFVGKPHAEIAADLGIPLGTVKSRLRLAMGRLREMLVDLS